ncbi:hypothetical protein Hdeb2414_s0012g00392571 [Helianthus debilis subsp. tardiflorus]
MLFMLKTVMVVASGVRLSSGDGCGIMVVLMFGFRFGCSQQMGSGQRSVQRFGSDRSTRVDSVKLGSTQLTQSTDNTVNQSTPVNRSQRRSTTDPFGSKYKKRVDSVEPSQLGQSESTQSSGSTF